MGFGIGYFVELVRQWEIVVVTIVVKTLLEKGLNLRKFLLYLSETLLLIFRFRDGDEVNSFDFFDFGTAHAGDFIDMCAKYENRDVFDVFDSDDAMRLLLIGVDDCFSRFLIRV